MTNKTLILLTILLAASCAGRKETLRFFVDPQLGTAHSRWFFYTPAARPFGMAKPAPTTDGHYGNPSGWEAVGYDSRHTSIEGFAAFHEFQIGGIVLAPTTGDLKTVAGDLENPDGGYRSRFDKRDEFASPGYYSVILKDYGVKAELTSTKRVALHRFSYPASSQAHLIFNVGVRMGESGEIKDAYVKYTEDNRVEGYVVTEPAYVNIYQKGGLVPLYFSAVLNAEPSGVGTFVGENIFHGRKEQKGAGAGIYLDFEAPCGLVLEVKVGLSYTSVENARINLKEEAEGLSFDTCRKDAEEEWEENLGRIKVEGGKESDKIKFYTGLFHALLGRGLANDANGAYPKKDGSIGFLPMGPDGKPVHNHYNTDAIWGGFWNLTQLWALVWPEYYADWISSQLLIYKDAGWLGDGIACSRYVSGVGTNFVGLAIAAAYNCGIRNFDVKTAYEAARKDALEYKERIEGAGKMDLKQFVHKGYSPYSEDLSFKTDSSGSGFAVSHTLEYSFNSYAVAQMAKDLGHYDDYEKLIALSEGWKNVFDKETKLVRPKDSQGQFIRDFDPYAPWKGFQEGNAVQYTYYVPHTPDELISVIGAEEFNKRLDSTFIISRQNVFGGGKTVNAFSGLHTYYNHGNQPNLHISGLFNFSGKPWLSQKWMRTICNEFYGTDSLHGYGYGQDEDQGQLGAWFVMASMGLFDVRGLTSPSPSFQIVSPLFDKITIKMNKNYSKADKFTIYAVDNSDENIYINSVELNGKKRNHIGISLDEIKKGSSLKIMMKSKPNLEICR